VAIFSCSSMSALPAAVGRNIISFARAQSGATAIEYAFIASLIAMVIIGGVTLLGNEITSLYQDIAEKAGDALASNGGGS
jgi:pilus assembly protein Flp/PilA